MHNIQQKLLNLARNKDLSGLTLRKIGELINESGSPQKIKHHLDQLMKKGLIVVDKNSGNILIVKSGANNNGNLYSLPIMGSANCGEAVCFADDRKEGYLNVTKHILGDYVDRVKSLFVVKAIGDSMNKSNINGNLIEDGDFLIIDRDYKAPESNDYVLSIINGAANVKKLLLDKNNSQYILISESTRDYPPIYIHNDDMDQYYIAGKVVKVMKHPENNWEDFMNASGEDTLKSVGSQSKEEKNYYENL